MLIKLVEDIERAIEHECYFSALALALTLPDICGKAEYPELKVGERYKKWCQKYICPIRSKEAPYSGDMPYLNEDMIFSLRNFFLHQGTPNVEPSSIWDDRCQIDHFKLKITDPDTPDGELSMVSYYFLLKLLKNRRRRGRIKRGDKNGIKISIQQRGNKGNPGGPKHKQG